MAKPKKTKQNPRRLTAKQSMVVEDMVHDVESGQGLDPTKSHLKIYRTKKKSVASVMANENLKRPNFRQALIDGLTKRKILGKNSQVEKQLQKGLKATHKGKPDHKTRLAYIQEINKVAGVYAPEKKQIGKLNINLDLTPDQLKNRVKQLKDELET